MKTTIVEIKKDISLDWLNRRWDIAEQRIIKQKDSPEEIKQNSVGVREERKWTLPIDTGNKMCKIHLIRVSKERGNIEGKMVENFPKPLKFLLILLSELILFQVWNINILGETHKKGNLKDYSSM